MGDAKALSKYPKTEFVGYDVDECTSNILAIFAKSDEGMEEVEQADSGMSVIILTERLHFMLKAVDRKEILVSYPQKQDW